MRIAKRITAFFIARGVWDREQEDIYEYGVEIVINNLALTMLLVLLGVVTRTVINVLCFIVIFTVLRTQCGGYHANTRIGCGITTIFSVIIVVMLSRICVCREIYVKVLLYFVSIVICIIYAPAENVKKPIIDERKPMLKIGSCIIITVLFFISVIAYHYEDVSNTIMPTVAWIMLLMVLNKLKRRYT